MIAENRFSDKEEKRLASMRLRFEMAVAAEWVVRDEDQPDNLLVVFVAPTANGEELQGACCCSEGTRDLPCPHALGVFKEIRANPHILDEILRRRPAPAAA